MAYPYLTNEQFRDRIRQICGIPETTGAPKSDPCVVRAPSDTGFYPKSAYSQSSEETEATQ